MHLRIIPVRTTDGAIREVIICGSDIIKQEQAEQMSDAQVQLAVKASGVGMWDWDLVTDQLVWTNQKKALFGLSADTPISNEHFLALLHPDDRERVHRLNMRALAEKQEY